MTRVRGHSVTAWIGVAIGVGIFVAVRADGAPLLSSSLLLLAHVVAVLWLDDRLTASTCSVATCERDGSVSVSESQSLCPTHAADFYETAAEAAD